MDYISTPQKITIKELIKNQCSWSPSQYKKIEIKNKNTFTVEQLLAGQDLISGKEVGSSAYVPFSTPYRFVRTKTIQEDSFQPDLGIEGSFEYITPNAFETNKGKKDEREINENDLLFVTGGNVGEVALANNIGKSIYSSHITKVPLKENCFYVFAFLKNNFGKEQANFGPVGAIAGLDTFTEKTLLEIEIPFPQQKNKEDVIKYIETLVKMILAKERKIKEKNTLLNKVIEEELLNNQKSSKFVYAPVTIKDLKVLKRLDTGMYSEEYQKTKFLIENYSLGSNTFDDLNYKISRGQNLQISNIGQSIYSESFKPNFYKLILSKDFSDWMTSVRASYLGNSKDLKQIQKGDIVFSCRGDLGRVFIFLEDREKTITNIDNVHIVNKKASLGNKVFIAAFLSYLRTKSFLSQISITGSGADSFTQYQFGLIKFPNFSQKKQEDIKEIYTNSHEYPQSDLNTAISKDAEWNNIAGIYEIDFSLKSIKAKINTLIEAITRDEDIDIDYSFLRLG